jgi:hypothetical protein
MKADLSGGVEFYPYYTYLSGLNNVAATHATIRKTMLGKDHIHTLPTSIFHVAVQLRRDNDNFLCCILPPLLSALD